VAVVVEFVSSQDMTTGCVRLVVVVEFLSSQTMAVQLSYCPNTVIAQIQDMAV